MSIVNIDDTTLDEIINYSDGQAIDGLWHRLDMFTEFSERKNMFLSTLKCLLKEGRIKLHKNGIFLESSIEDQIDLFMRAFPKNEKDAHQRAFNTDEPQCRPATAMGLWFFLDDCPAGVAWRQKDGHYEIAD